MLHFGWLCLIVLLLVLEHFERTGKGLWLLPPLFALWINLHGSWVFGFVVIGIYIISGLVEAHWNNVGPQRWTPSQLEKLLLAFAASAVALLANPHGYRLVSYPFELLSRQQAVRDNMIEWQSGTLHSFPRQTGNVHDSRLVGGGVVFSQAVESTRHLAGRICNICFAEPSALFALCRNPSGADSCSTPAIVSVLRSKKKRTNRA